MANGQNFVHYFPISQYFVPNCEQCFYVKFSWKNTMQNIQNALIIFFFTYRYIKSYSHNLLNLSIKVQYEHRQNSILLLVYLKFVII